MANIQTQCLDCVDKSTCFQQLNTHELSLTTESKVQVTYKKGETIAKQGSFVTHILYVRKGTVKVYKEIEDGTNIIYNVLPAGSLIGLSALFFSETFQYSMAALNDSKICAIDKKVIENLFRDNSNFSVNVITILNEEILHLRNKMISLTRKQMAGRLADSLLHLKNKVYNSGQFRMTLSRKELAEFSGMSTMSVVRTLQMFIKKGIIGEESGIMEVINGEELESLSQISG